MYNELNIKTETPRIIVITNVNKSGSSKIEKTFYNAFEKQRQTKADSTILTFATIISSFMCMSFSTIKESFLSVLKIFSRSTYASANTVI